MQEHVAARGARARSHALCRSQVEPVDSVLTSTRLETIEEELDGVGICVFVSARDR